VSRAKSDAGDAFVLANILRTDRDAHRPLPADSNQAKAIRVLRAQQDAIWDRQQIGNKLRSLLREYFPAALAAFPDLAHPDAIEVLQLPPTPAAAAKLTRASIRAALRRAGRQRYFDAATEPIHRAFRVEHLRQPAAVETAMGEHALALLRSVATARRNTERLQEALAAAFDQHPDAAIITSTPGLGPMPGARLLGQIGDDRERFTEALGLKAFAGSAPVTRASESKTAITARLIRNKRLGQAGYLWAFSLLTASAGARAHYDRRRDRGDNHAAACRTSPTDTSGSCITACRPERSTMETIAFPPAPQSNRRGSGLT
jgi:Transposase/Transposase IS116/IS110/IS902 family